MLQTETLVVGASISGLAMASCLQKQKLEHIIIEKEPLFAVPWRNHYHRLHLHTNKRISGLPYRLFDNTIPRYPSRRQVVDYLESYRKRFNIKPVFNSAAKWIKKEDEHWITETAAETFKSKFVVIATGAFAKARPINFKGMETYTGTIMHSCDYKTGRDFMGQKVLVVGFGNSACEIAIDLFEQGALPCMAVRSAVNVIPRDILGIPVLELSLLMSRLPPRLIDTLNAPLLKLICGDITKLGLKKKEYGPFEEIIRNRKTPVLDIGTLKHIREGHIAIYGDVDHIDGKTVHFSDGKRDNFNTIVAAIGYNRNCEEFLDVGKHRFNDLDVSVTKQMYFGDDGLYFCGFWISPTGQIREICADARKIARDIGIKTGIQ